MTTNKFWLINDDGKTATADVLERIYRLRDEGVFNVVSLSKFSDNFTDVVTHLVVVSALSQEELTNLFFNHNLGFRFSTAEGVAEFGLGLAYGFDVAMRAAFRTAGGKNGERSQAESVASASNRGGNH